jgi:hypothetical protein
LSGRGCVPNVITRPEIKEYEKYQYM